MKRGITILVASAAMATPAIAAAGWTNYAGSVIGNNSAKISLEVKTKHGELIGGQVRNFAFKAVPVQQCDQGRITTSDTVAGPVKIKNIREQAAFRASARLAEGGTVRVIGTLTRGKASGIIQFEGTLPTDDGPDATGCEGGAGWTASR